MGNKNTPSMHHPRRWNVSISVVGLKTVTYAKISPKIANLRDIAGEHRRRRRRRPKELNKFVCFQVDQAQFQKVLDYCRYGLEDGATLQAGGKRVGDKGYFVQPTVFSDVQDNMRIAKEEVWWWWLSVFNVFILLGGQGYLLSPLTEALSIHSRV